MQIIKAIQNKDVNKALELIQKPDTNLTFVTRDRETLLAWACYERLPTVAMALLETGKMDVNKREANGNTALRWCFNGKKSVYKMDSVAWKIINQPNFDLDYDAKTIFKKNVRYRKWDFVQFYLSQPLEFIKKWKLDLNSLNNAEWNELPLKWSNDFLDFMLEQCERSVRFRTQTYKYLNEHPEEITRIANRTAKLERPLIRYLVKSEKYDLINRFLAEEKLNIKDVARYNNILRKFIKDKANYNNSLEIEI